MGRGAKSFSHGTEYSEVGTDGRTDGQMEGRMDGGGVDWRGGFTAKYVGTVAPRCPGSRFPGSPAVPDEIP